MNLEFDQGLAAGYKSASQRIRILSEYWVDNTAFCPSCGHFSIDKYPNNRPVADFYCVNCQEEYELKSKQNNFCTKVVDGAYHTMIERLKSRNNPNFFLLDYDLNFSVKNFLVIPKHFFVQEIIEKRKPLAKTAQRAGWIGCNILLKNIPQAGKIFLVRNRQIVPTEDVLLEWQKTLFLREEKEVSEKGWILDVMRSVEAIGKREFTLEEVYLFEEELSKLHPENKHIKDKIRQQLQLLRDRGYLSFIGRGLYSLT